MRYTPTGKQPLAYYSNIEAGLLTGCEIVLAAPELTIQRCNTVNPATQMVLPVDGAPYDCVEVINTFMPACEDMHNVPIVADLTLFVGGSCYRDATGYHVGYTIVQMLNQ